MFVFPWAHAMFWLAPFPVLTEYFYNAIQRWAKLPAFYRLFVGQSAIVVFLERDALSKIK